MGDGGGSFYPFLQNAAFFNYKLLIKSVLSGAIVYKVPDRSVAERCGLLRYPHSTWKKVSCIPVL